MRKGLLSVLAAFSFVALFSQEEHLKVIDKWLKLILICHIYPNS